MYNRLITCGCSHTFGEEMQDVTNNTDPSVHAWPSELQQYLDIPKLNNIARPGKGNDFIARTLIKEVPKYRNEKLLVGVMFTAASRFEFIKLFGPDTKRWLDVTITLFKKPERYPEWVIQYMLDEHQEFAHQYNLMKHMLYLQLFFNSNDIDYFFAYTKNAIEPDFSLTTSDDDLSYFKDLIDQTKIYNPKLGNFLSWCNANNYKQGPGTHPLEEAHHDYVHQKLGPWVKENYDV